MKAFFSYILLIFISWTNVFSQTVPTYTSAIGRDIEVKSFYYFLTPDTSLGIEQVISENFKPSLKNDLGITNNVIWVNFKIKNTTPNDFLFLEVVNPMLERITFYNCNNNIVIDSLATGRYNSFYKRHGDFVNYIFPLKIKSGTESSVFIKIKTNTPTHLPVFLSTENMLLKRSFNETLLFGIYIGIILIMLVYHIFISFTVNDKAYIYYIIYIACVGFAQVVLKGYAFKYLWPDNIWLSINSFNLSGFLSGMATLIFTNVFLQTRKNAPRLHIVINIIIGVYFLILFIHFFLDKFLAFRIINVGAFIGSVIVIYTAYILMRRNFKPAKYFLLGFSVFLASVIIYVLRTSGFIGYNFFTSYILEIGSVIQITFLSFALADKINTYRREQTLARREALRISKENEKLVKEQNIMLEKEVKARTADLEKVNSDLNQTLRQLKMAQAKLVDSEKMASLGQLTAGVAHEINNPINFVASNVKPLELDINDVFDVLKKYEVLDPENNIKQQLAEIEAYKKDIDVEYIREEINMLLSGIKEGANRTAEIVKNLKNFVRLDQSHLVFANLNEGIESTLVLVRNTFPQNIIVEKHLAPTEKVECAPGKINQVFMNIITNAVQAMRMKQYAGDEKPRLIISSVQQEGHVAVSIKDNGIGMNSDIIEKIYEPFFTTKEVGEGTGLGMSIVKGIIENHNGTLHINSTPGEGSEFIVTLPVKSAL